MTDDDVQILTDAIVSLLDWAERHRAGDPALTDADWYEVLDLVNEALDRTTQVE